MSSANWVSEFLLEPIIRPNSEPEQPYYSSHTTPRQEIKILPPEQPYYSPPERYIFLEGKDIEITRSSEVYTIRQVLKSYIPSLITTLLGKESICSVDIYDDNLYGTVAMITIDLPAKDALELWLKLIDYLPYENYKIVLSLKWLGERNVSEDELINYIVKIMIKSKIRPKALPEFDAVRIVQETRV